MIPNATESPAAKPTETKKSKFGFFRKKTENPIVSSLHQFIRLYNETEKSLDKTALMPRLVTILGTQAKKWKIVELQQLASLYLILQPRDRKNLIEIIPEQLKIKMQKKISQGLEFPPLLLFADQCELITTKRTFGPFQLFEWNMPEIYSNTFNALDFGGKTLFHSRIVKEKKNVEPPPPLDLAPLEFDRKGAEARIKNYTLHSSPFSAAITSTHQNLPSNAKSIEEDPIADDCGFYQDNHCLIGSLTDGGGNGEDVANAAIHINRCFIGYILQLIQKKDLSAIEILKRANYQTASYYHSEGRKESVTHTGLLVRKQSSTLEVAVSLIGDTGAYLLIEMPDQNLLLEKLLPLPYGKATSCNGGCFSSHSDFSSFRFCHFTVPLEAKRVLVIQGSDGLWENFDPRNALKEEISLAISELMQDERKFYTSQELWLENGPLLLSQIYLNSHDQKDEIINKQIHRFPHPNDLNRDPGSGSTNNSWKEAPLEQLVPQYEKFLIEKIYRESSPDDFATRLVEHAKRQGKPDDICVLVTTVFEL